MLLFAMLIRKLCRDGACDIRIVSPSRSTAPDLHGRSTASLVAAARSVHSFLLVATMWPTVLVVRTVLKRTREFAAD